MGKLNPENIRPYQWKKGQSGNPSGRPKGVAGFIQRKAGKDYQKCLMLDWIIAHGTDEQFRRTFPTMKRTLRDRAEANARLLDRAIGRPTQAISHGSDPDHPLTPPTINNHFDLPGTVPVRAAKPERNDGK